MSHAVCIRKIDQKDNHTFAIQWSDGKTSEYRLSELQKRCPCAGCIDDSTGKRPGHLIVEEDVRAFKITSVGRYALRVFFTTGCSAGIYSYDMLRDL